MRRVSVGRTRVPELPDPFVARARLLAALDDGYRTVLVCAPAGFGKTALLAHWARSAVPDTPVAWADLASGVGDHIWPVILASLTAYPAVPSDSALHELGRGASYSPTPAFDADVVSALNALPARVTLILHDIHEVVAPALGDLETLLTARPAGLRLVLCSRWDTPLPPLGPAVSGQPP